MLTGLKFKSNIAGSVISTGGLTVQPKHDALSPGIVKHNITGVSTKTVADTSDDDIVSTHTTKSTKQTLLATKGLNSFRPEIVMATKFVPVYDITGTSLTNHGELLDIQIAARNIRADNVSSFVQKLIANEETATVIEELSRSYTNQLDKTRDDIRFMIDAYAAIDSVIKCLNIANNVELLKRIANDMLDDDNDVLDIRRLFIERMGFSNEGFLSFTNTKIFGQLLFDLGNCIRRYTYKLFDTIDQDRNADINPIKYDRTVAFPTSKFAFDIGDYANFEVTTNSFSTQIFERFINSQPTQLIDKLKLQCITLSRIYCISAALGTKSVQADLRRLNISDTADDPFIDIIGVPGITVLNNIDEQDSLIGLTQIDEQNVGIVLPFERKFIVSRIGKKFTPGADFFFDGLIGTDTFDVGRITRFENIFEQRITAAMNIFEAAARVDTPFVRQQYAQYNKLTAIDIHNRALNIISNIIAEVSGSGQQAKNYLFIFAIIDMAQHDKQLKHLLFQTSIVATLYSLLHNHDLDFEFVNDMIQNEFKTFGNLPALTNFFADIVVGSEAGVFENINIGETKTHAASEAIISVAYHHLQKLIFNHIFDVLGQRVNIGYIHSLLAQPGSQAQAFAFLQAFNTQYMSQAMNSVGQGANTFAFAKPTVNQTFDNDFANILLSISSFTDSLEDDAGSQGAIGKSRKRAHLLRNKTGKTRYMNISSSSRFMFSFELLTTLIGGFNFVKFGSIDITGNNTTIIYNNTRIQAFATAALNPTTTQQVNSESVIQNEFSSVPNTNMIVDFKSLFSSVNSSLNTDAETIRSMTLNIRAFVNTFDDTTDNLKVFFNSHGTDITRIIGKSHISRNLKRRIGKQKRIGKILYGNENDHEKKPNIKRALLTRQQLALALVKLNDLSLSNIEASPSQLPKIQGYTASATDIFVDGTRVTSNVRAALLSLLTGQQYNNSKHQKILSVAIPSGMADYLADEFTNARQGDIDHESDIITVNVHMRDIIENDIIFKPLSFQFELSRFVSAWSFNQPSDNLEFMQIMNEIKMFDASSFDNKTLRGEKIDAFMINQNYSFMNDDDKRKLVLNHIVSYLLSVYIKMMTSIDVREEAFHVIDPINDDVDDSNTIQLYTKLAELIVKQSNNSISLDNLRDKFPAFDAMLTAIEEGEFYAGVFEQQTIFDTIQAAKINPIVAKDISDIMKLSSSRSSLTGGERLRKNIISPKLFERVFNIIVNPQNFEIDINLTQATVAGKSAYDRLFRTNNIKFKKEQAFVTDIRNNAVVTDQYFVTISKYDNK